jgi:uncharacterized protein YqiB (DUF1249 family)
MVKLDVPPPARAEFHLWPDILRQTDRPRVGDLMALCEENYGRLRRLAPGLPGRRGDARSLGLDGMALYLEIMEQSRYTSLLRLTHFFPHDDGEEHRCPLADPDALLRAYHDARQVEVLDLRQTALPLHNHYRSPALEAKWRANLFLAKWMAHCIRLGHHFPQPQPDASHEDLSCGYNKAMVDGTD